MLPIRTMAISVITNPALVLEIPWSTSMKGRVRLWAKLVNPAPQLTRIPTDSLTTVLVNASRARDPVVRDASSIPQS